MKSNPFYICAANDITITKKIQGYNLNVNLPPYKDSKVYINGRPLDKNGFSKNPWIIKLTKRKNPSAGFIRKQLKLLDKLESVKLADKKHPIRWLGSGAMLIIRTAYGKEYAVLNKRHITSAWGGYFDANGGYGSSLTDLLSPKKLAIREISEEIKFISPKGINLKTAKLYSISLNPQTSVSVRYNNKKYISRNLALIVDPDTGTVDFRQVFRVNIKSLDELILTDGETRFANPHKEILQGRPILLYLLSDLKKMAGRPNFRPVPIKGYENKNEMDKLKLKKFAISNKTITPALTCILKSLIYTSKKK